MKRLVLISFIAMVAFIGVLMWSLYRITQNYMFWDNSIQKVIGAIAIYAIIWVPSVTYTLFGAKTPSFFFKGFVSIMSSITIYVSGLLICVFVLNPRDRLYNLPLFVLSPCALLGGFLVLKYIWRKKETKKADR